MLKNEPWKCKSFEACGSYSCWLPWWEPHLPPLCLMQKQQESYYGFQLGLFNLEEDVMVSQFHICCPGCLKAGELSVHLSIPTTVVGPCSWCLVVTQPYQPITPRRAMRSLCPWCPALCLHSDYSSCVPCCFLHPSFFILPLLVLLARCHLSQVLYWSGGEIGLGEWGVHSFTVGEVTATAADPISKELKVDCKHILESVIHYSHVEARWSCSPALLGGAI